MLDATYQKLLRLLDPQQPTELRCAAALVLGEVGNKDDELAEALCGVLDDPDTALRLQAMTAVGKLRIERGLPQLLARARQGGPEADVAAQAAARLGSKGLKAI